MFHSSQNMLSTFSNGTGRLLNFSSADWGTRLAIRANTSKLWTECLIIIDDKLKQDLQLCTNCLELCITRTAHNDPLDTLGA